MEDQTGKENNAFFFIYNLISNKNQKRDVSSPLINGFSFRNPMRNLIKS
jgi:hypothetical protein